MTRRERDDLSKLVRRREKVAKTDANQRAAELQADVERQLAMRYQADDANWQDLTARANAAIATADAELAARCRELGVPETFRPRLSLAWSSRGDNSLAERRNELRKVAMTRIEALRKGAHTEIERQSVEVQTKLLAGGLETDAARGFLESMPTADDLMPPLALTEVEAAVPLPRPRE